MKYNLTDKQRRFLEKAIKLYQKWPDVEFPRTRVSNILYRGYYFDDASSQSIEPIKSRRPDKLVLNQVGASLREYFKKNDV